MGVWVSTCTVYVLLALFKQSSIIHRGLCLSVAFLYIRRLPTPHHGKLPLYYVASYFCGDSRDAVTQI